MTGKAGAGLKAIVDESGAKIRVGHEEELPPGSNERLVYVIGKRAERDRALALIQAKVGGRAFGTSNPANTIVRAPLRCVGFLMGTFRTWWGSYLAAQRKATHLLPSQPARRALFFFSFQCSLMPTPTPSPPHPTTGPGGSNIRAVREKAGVKISMAKVRVPSFPLRGLISPLFHTPAYALTYSSSLRSLSITTTRRATRRWGATTRPSPLTARSSR